MMSVALAINVVTLVVMALIGVIFASIRRDSRDNKKAISNLDHKLTKLDDSVDGVKLEIKGLNGKYKEWTREFVKSELKEQVKACRDREEDLSGVHSLAPNIRKIR